MDQKDLALAIAETMPETSTVQDDLVALGMVVSGVICTAEECERNELVEKFCETLRKSMASQLN